MIVDSTEDPYEAAIQQLQHFGLSTYAAKTFVGLAGLGTGTAREIAQVSDVPRTRVYDATDELYERGLVDIQHTTPKEFWSLSAETTSRSFEREFHRRAEVLQTSLNRIEPVERRAEQRGVWTVNGQDAVSARVLEFFDTAEDEIVYMTIESLLSEDILAGLHTAADRGVSIKLAGVSSDVQASIEGDIPGAEMFDSLWVWSDTPAGRLMMVDNQRTLVSALVNGLDDAPTDTRSETAIWGAGEANSLVVILKAIFTWQLHRENEDVQ